MKCFDQIKQHEAFKGKVQSMLDLADKCHEPEECLIHNVLNIIKNEEFEFGSDFGGMNLSTQRVLVVLLVHHVLSLKVVDVDDSEEEVEGEE